MKKETRFSAKCERFIKLIVQLMPLIVFVGFLIYPFLCALSDNNLGLSFENSTIPNFFSSYYMYYYDDALLDGFYDFVSVYLIPYDFDSVVQNIISFFRIGSPSISYFMIYYFIYLVWVEIIWLIKNVLMFLPKIGNYFITKWSGD